MKRLLVVLILCLVCSGCWKEEPVDLYDITFTCDLCEREFIIKNQPSGYGREYVEVDGCWLMLCNECLGDVRHWETEEQVVRREDMLKELRLKYKAD